MDTAADTRTKRALHEVGVTLLCLLEVHRAAPDLVEQAAEELEGVLRRHLGEPKADSGSRGKRAFERFLDELEDELEDDVESAAAAAM